MRVSLAAGALLVVSLTGCVTRDDGVLLLRRREARREGEPTTLAYVQPHDVPAAHIRALLADGFGAELLRTFAMARRLAGRGGDPTIVAFGSEDTMQSPADNAAFIDAINAMPDGRGEAVVHEGANHGFGVLGSPAYHEAAASASYDRAFALFAAA